MDLVLLEGKKVQASFLEASDFLFVGIPLALFSPDILFKAYLGKDAPNGSFLSRVCSISPRYFARNASVFAVKQGALSSPLKLAVFGECVFSRVLWPR